MNKTEQQREHFNSIAEKYIKARNHENHTALKKLIWQSALQDKVWLRKKNLKVLEVMCGYADGYDIISRYNSSIVYKGSDYSDEVIKALEKSKPHLNIVHQDVINFSDEKKYDVIILLGGLHHVYEHTENIILTLRNSLTDNGRIISFEPTHGNNLFKYIRDAIYKKNELFDHDTEQAYKVEELLDAFKNSGLQLEHISYPGLLSYVLYYNPDAFPFLNKGSTKLVNALWSFEKPFVKSKLAKILSFATLTIWKR